MALLLLRTGGICGELFRQEKCIKGQNGTFIILALKVENSHFFWLIFSRQNNDSTQQVKFFEDLQGLLSPFSGENIIIGGDFNCPLMSADKQGGRSVHFKQNVIMGRVDVKKTATNKVFRVEIKR